MFVIGGATGNTGSAVATELLAQGKPVRVIVRDAHKGEPWRKRGAEVAIAELTDAAALTAALRGADGVYVMLPPNHHAEDLLAAQEPILAAWKAALTAARPKHVVALSSIGAERTSGTGPIMGNHRLEEMLAAVGLPVTRLRAAYFMENWGAMVRPAKSDGVLPSMLTLGRACDMVATADIGKTAAALLIEGAPAAGVVELAGPREVTPEEVAAAFGRALGRTVTAVPVPETAIEGALAQAGMKPKVAALYREMVTAFNGGQLRFAGAPRRGTTAIDKVVRGLVA